MQENTIFRTTNSRTQNELQTDSGLVVANPEILRPTDQNEPIMTQAPFFESEETGLLIPKGHLSVPQKEAPTILRPEKSDIQRLSVKEEEKRGFENNYIYYLSNPWNYFESGLKKHQLPSPCEEIQQRVADAKKLLPDKTSLILLNSPNALIRDSEKQRLVEGGIPESVVSMLVGAGTIQDIQLFNSAELDFSTLKEDSDSSEADAIKRFDAFLVETIAEIFTSLETVESVKKFASFIQKLDTIVQTFQYRYNAYKLDNPKLLDTIAQLLETHPNKSKIDARYLAPIFDFISNFEINSSAAAKSYQAFLSRHKYSHPLEHELEYQLHPDARQDTTAPKIGLEIEGVPRVIWKQVPEGFEQGVDHGLAIPEYRKDIQHLHFDATFKKQLYDFWYWAKKTQLVGASLHVHLDGDESLSISNLNTYFGYDANTMRYSRDKDTVELRFNLSGYTLERDSNASLDISTPFFHEQYNFAGVITFLESFRESSPSDFDAVYNELPYFWKTHFSKQVETKRTVSKLEQEKKEVFQAMLKGHTLLEFFSDTEMIRFAENNTREFIEALNSTPSLQLSKEDFFAICSNLDFTSHQIQHVLHEKIDSPIGFEETLKYVMDNDNEHAGYLFEYLSEPLTYEQLQKIYDTLPKITPVVNMILLSTVSGLSKEAFEEIFDEFDWNAQYFEVDVFKKLFKQKATLEECVYFFDKFSWHTYVVSTASEEWFPELSYEDILVLEKKAPNFQSVFPILKNFIRDTLTVSEYLHLIEATNYSLFMADELIQHLEKPLTLSKLNEIINSISPRIFDSPAIVTLLSCLDPEEFTEDVLIDFCNEASSRFATYHQQLKMCRAYPKPITINSIFIKNRFRHLDLNTLRALFTIMEPTKSITKPQITSIFDSINDPLVITEVVKRIDVTTFSENDKKSYLTMIKRFFDMKHPYSRTYAFWASLQLIFNDEPLFLLKELKG